MKHVRFPTNARRPSFPEIPEGGLKTEVRINDYAKNVTSWADSCKPSKFYSAAELDAGFTAYEDMIRGQKSLESTYSDFTSLTLAVKNLKHLKTMCILTNDGENSTYFCRKLSQSGNLVEGGELLDMYWEESRTFEKRQIASALLSIFSALPQLEHLEIHALYWDLLMENFTIGVAINAFIHLRTLSLDIKDAMDASSGLEKGQHALAQALQSFKKLESLELYLSRYEITDENAE